MQSSGEEYYVVALPQQRGPRKTRSGHPVVLVQGEFAVALITAQSRVVLPEEGANENQTAMRVATLFEPSFFAEHVVVELFPLDPRVALSWPRTCVGFKRELIRTHANIDQHVLSNIKGQVSFLTFGEPAVSRILRGEWKILSSVGVRNARQWIKSQKGADNLPPPSRDDFAFASSRRADFGVGPWRERKRQRGAPRDEDIVREVLWTRFTAFFGNM